jgi:hypothetical protein
LVAAGTVYDMLHKGSARYFFDSWDAMKRRGVRRVGGGEIVGLALATAAEALASGEFCSTRRRNRSSPDNVWFRGVRGDNRGARLLLSDARNTGSRDLAGVWSVGALMICVAGIGSGSSSGWMLRRRGTLLASCAADLFILSLLASATLALFWAYAQVSGSAWALPLLGCT